MARQFGLPTKDHPPRLRALPSLPRSRADQFTLELSQSAQYGQHQPTVRCCRVGPRVPQGFEPGALFANSPEQIEQIACRPRQSVESCDDEYIALYQDRQAQDLSRLGARHRCCPFLRVNQTSPVPDRGRLLDP